MSAYAAAATLKYFISELLRFVDLVLPSHTVKNHEFLVKELESFMLFAERMDSGSRKMMNNSLAKITEAMREAEEALICGNVEYLEYRQGNHLVDSLRKTKEEYYSMVGDEGSSSSKSKMVGLRDERSLLKEIMVLNKWDVNVITIFGMAGIVSTEWNSEEVTQAILSQTGYKEETGAADLKEWLEAKRYLIVLDNIWSFSIEESMKSYLKSSFPDGKCGSRILLTGRIKISGPQSSFPRYPFEKRLLNKEESWHLLCEKVFGGDSCPPQLVEAGKKIAEKCDGLPLTIVTVADLLTKAEETPESLWINVAEKKKHQLFIDAYDQMSKVLYPSYKELYDELKLCFLYLGVFPLKHEITTSKLINLWIAEEVIPTPASTLEYFASQVLQFFELNCLMMVHRRSTSSSPYDICPLIKTCSLHSSWWHFCQREARRINFFHVLDSYEDGLGEGIQCQSRLSFHNNVLFALKDVYNSIEENCASTAQSLLCFGPYNQYMVPICFGLKLLMRLDALNIRFYDFPIEVLELVKLRYLALTCNGQLPPLVSKLENLQYFIVRRHMSIKSCGAVSNFPMEIWDMETLKHLQVEGSDPLDLGDASLHNLSALLGVSTGSCAVLERVPNIKKLGIIIELRPDGKAPLCSFDHISHLTKLESLKCVIVNPEWKSEVVSPVASFQCLPFSLKKLSLSGLSYPWEEMSSIASLPNLETLKLRYNAFRGPKWEVDENGFQKLRFLLMESIDVVTLKWASESFKCLELLRIAHCYKLKELDICNLPKLWMIEMVDSNPLVELSVKEKILQQDIKMVELEMHYSWKS